MLTLESGEALTLESGDTLALEASESAPPRTVVVADPSCTAWYNGQAAGSQQYKELDAVRFR